MKSLRVSFIIGFDIGNNLFRMPIRKDVPFVFKRASKESNHLQTIGKSKLGILSSFFSPLRNQRFRQLYGANYLFLSLTNFLTFFSIGVGFRKRSFFENRYFIRYTRLSCLTLSNIITTHVKKTLRGYRLSSL